MKFKARELWYWHVQRKTQKFVPWVARKLPKKLKYFVIIDGISEITVNVDQYRHPDTVTGMELLNHWS